MYNLHLHFFWLLSFASDHWPIGLQHWYSRHFLLRIENILLCGGRSPFFEKVSLSAYCSKVRVRHMASENSRWWYMKCDSLHRLEFSIPDSRGVVDKLLIWWISSVTVPIYIPLMFSSVGWLNDMNFKNAASIVLDISLISILPTGIRYIFVWVST